MDDADLEREQTYTLAQELEYQLGTVLAQLDDLHQQINGEYVPDDLPDTDEASQVVRVLNVHHQSLTHLENRANSVKAESDELVGRLSRAVRDA